jgi:signal transduction histidine kinase
LLPLVATALRYGLRSAVLMVFLLDSGLILSVTLLQQQSVALQYQLVMTAIALVGLWLGGAVTSRNRLISSQAEELRTEVARQTLALQLANEELHEQRAAAEQANREKSRFLASASHDLRQPAHALGLFIDRLDQVSIDYQSTRLVASATEAVREMQDMLEGMFDLSRLDVDSTQTRLESFPVKTLFDALRTGLANEATAKGLCLRVRPSNVWLDSDPNLLRRILLNLVNNSIRYTSSGSILVACRPTRGGTHARIEVWDSGIGIAPEHQEHVFKEFYQVANPQRDRRSGLGVGLSIVERCCRLLELPLSLRSVLGGGTRVTVVVPLANAKPMVNDEGQGIASSSDALGGVHVMVIEDDALGREALTGLLESWGYSVSAAESAKIAAARFQKNRPPDIIISDLRLGGGINGIEAVDMLRSLAGQKIAACLISGDTDTHAREQAQAAGLVLLSKPVRPAKLRATLRHLSLPVAVD